MIIVTVQYVDANGGPYNGGTSIHFYNLKEARRFAETESANFPGTGFNTEAICKVYNDGYIDKVYLAGAMISA